MILQDTLDLRVVSSLAKIFADEEIKDCEQVAGTTLLNECYSFQVAYKWNGSLKKHIAVNMASQLSEGISLFKVGLVPSEMPCYADHDDNVLRATPGLYPDALLPIDSEGLTLLPAQWHSVWVEFVPSNAVKPGVYPISLSFCDEEGTILGSVEFKLELVAARLPEQELINTNWFHTDCLATWYGLEVFSEAHWRRIEQYVRTAARHGINMLLTPVFTPPLDTWIGGERPTVQLVDVEAYGNSYKFGFSKLKRWFDMCLANGIRYFEISHLFTQWGARHAPKIMGKVRGEEQRLFGWETDAGSNEYKNFMSLFLPELVSLIRREGLEDRCYFHVSDEPNLDHLESYKSALGIISEHLKDFPIIDALSNYEFYEKGLVKCPIPATNHIEPFISNDVPGLWAYYCCGQYKEVSNRFFNMPSARNRILGYQLYKFNIKGFLHWGYNFWYSQYSRYPVDPWRVTDAVHAYPSGDAFVVYPDKEGPVVSLRLKVFYDALQDLRALQLLESLIGKDAVLEIIDEGLDSPLTFSKYPSDEQWLLQKREQINRLIAEKI